MATTMEDQLLSLLRDTQSPSEGPRKQAELHLLQARTNPAFPTSLATIATHASVTPDIRQSALLILRSFVEKNWSGQDEDGPTIQVDGQAKEQLRTAILGLATGEEENSKIRTAASVVVSKIANNDFPEKWPSLLPTLLHLIQTGTDSQIHGSLKVLGELVEDALSDVQFFSTARDIVKVVYDVAINDNRGDILRALAVSVFRGCFSIMDIVKDEHEAQVKAFAEEALVAWCPFFLQILRKPLPARAAGQGAEDPSNAWRGIVALKLQVIKTLMKIRGVFPALLLPHSPVLFSTTWEELSLLQSAYNDMYVDNDEQGRLEDADRLPYTLDFLVLEELDFLQMCLRAPPVQKELESQLQTHGGIRTTPWIMDVMKLAVGYAQICKEEEELWDIDVNLFLGEETSVTANYTARTACGDLLIKLGEWLHQGALEGLLAYTQAMFSAAEATWRTREASLYLLTQLLNDFLDVDKKVAPEVAAQYLGLIDYAVNREEEPLLRARGYLVAGILVQSVPDVNPDLLDRTIKHINGTESEVVKVACIKALQGFIKANAVQADRQIPIIAAVSEFLHAKDLTDLEDADDLLVTLVETLRAAINIDPRVSISNEVGALDLLFVLAKHGAANFQMTIIVTETFEDIVTTMAAPDAYAAVCTKVLPSLTGAFDVGSMTEDDPLVELAADLLAVLTENGSEPLPPGFVAATMPKLTRLLLATNEGGILRPGVESIKFMLMHDHQQVFSWHDDTNRSGLEVCLVIIDRLLAPNMEDNSASEVGGLAAELVEKAGQERLGPYLEQLLKAVANRLVSAEAPQFIQSLILVFARLSLAGAHDVVEFLNQLTINGHNGLQVVLSKWLENSVNFAGYDEIRQNVIALSKLYGLNDARLAQTMVKGDLIIQANERIKTRSQSKKNPDQYTIIPAPLKILKVLISELLSASGAAPLTALAAAQAAAAEFADEENDDNDSWEDVPSVLDLNSMGVKNELMNLAEGGGGAKFIRQRDDETQQFLVDWFVTVGREDVGGFKGWWGLLTDEERGKLEEVGRQAGAS